MLKKGFELSFMAKYRLETKKPKRAYSQKCAKVLITVWFGALTKTEKIRSIKEPLVLAEFVDVWADKQNITMATATARIADIII